MTNTLRTTDHLNPLHRLQHLHLWSLEATYQCKHTHYYCPPSHGLHKIQGQGWPLDPTCPPWNLERHFIRLHTSPLHTPFCPPAKTSEWNHAYGHFLSSSPLPKISLDNLVSYHESTPTRLPTESLQTAKVSMSCQHIQLTLPIVMAQKYLQIVLHFLPCSALPQCCKLCMLTMVLWWANLMLQ